MVLIIFVILTTCFLIVPGIYLFWDYNSKNKKMKKNTENNINNSDKN